MAGLSTDKLSIPKTIKLFINGEFPRTESGRSFPIYYSDQKRIYAHLCQASRKDHRAAVTAAKEALKSWEERSAFNRSQILYRMAEMAEAKRYEFVEILEQAKGMELTKAEKAVSDAIDAFVYYAGFADKFSQVIGSVNPVNGPHHNFTMPEPVGVVGLICEEEFNFARIVSDICSIISSGNTLVALLPESNSAILASLAEVFATSDLPKGVVNLLSGSTEELYSHFGTHMEIQSLKYCGADQKKIEALRLAACENMKRFVTGKKDLLSLENILDFVEYKTVWHPIGS